MPRITETMRDGVLLRWLAPDGASVVEGQLIAEVAVEDRVEALEAPATGELLHGVAEGTEVGIGDPIGMVGAPPPAGPVQMGMFGAEDPAGHAEPVVSTPARRIAEELGVDLAAVVGTGPGGRIVRADVEAAAAGAAPPVSAIPVTTPDVGEPPPVPEPEPEPEPVPEPGPEVEPGPPVPPPAPDADADADAEAAPEAEILITSDAPAVVERDEVAEEPGEDAGEPSPDAGPPDPAERVTGAIALLRLVPDPPGPEPAAAAGPGPSADEPPDPDPGEPRMPAVLLERDVDVTELLRLRDALAAASDGPGPGLDALLVRAIALAGGDGTVAVSSPEEPEPIVVPGADELSVGAIAAAILDGGVAGDAAIAVLDLSAGGADRAIPGPAPGTVIAVGRVRPQPVVRETSVVAGRVITITLTPGDDLGWRHGAGLLERVAELLERPHALVL